MSIGAALYDRLTTHSGTSALISTRCYRVRLPDNPTLPAIVYHRVSSSLQRSSGRRDQGAARLRQGRWQINCWSSTSAGAEALAIQVRTAMEGWVDGVNSVAGTSVVSEFEDYESDAELYRVIIDILISLFE